MNIERVDVIYHGDVQGVGFRYTVVREASAFDVAGFVENQFDGTVHLIAEGPRDTLERFLRAIRHSRLSSHIESAATVWHPATGTFSSFYAR